MDKKVKILSFLLIILSLTAYAGAEEEKLLVPIPVFIEAKIQSKITYDSKASIYTYTYIVTNPATNTGKIWAIAIDISRPSDGAIFSSEGLTMPRGETGEIVTFEQELPAEFLEPISLVPIGMKLPYGWSGGLTPAGIARIASLDAPEISPGETLGGFELISRGLPTIREVIIEPWWIYSTEGSATEEGAKRAREIEASLQVKTKTLGPTAPPADFKPVAFIDYIISLKHEAATLGWIKNEGIINSLDVKLENAKKAIERNNIRPAKNLLEAFINEVEAQGCASYEKCVEGKHITPEGYGLLKYNAEYLLGKL